MSLGPFSIIPPKSKEFENQTELTALTDAEFSCATRPFRTTVLLFLYQLLCFLIFLGPIRVIFAVVICAFTVCVILTIRVVMGAIGVPRDARVACVAVARFGVRCILFSFGIIFVRTCGHTDLSARFVVCNHVGLLDAFIVFFLRDVVCAIDRCYRRPRALELLLECVDPVWVDWRTKHGYRRMICGSVDDFGRPPLLIFPEGKAISGCGDVVLRFEKTAFSTPYKVQPITIRYKMFAVPRNWNSYAYHGEGILWFIWRMFAFPPSIVSVHFLPAISMEGDGKAEMQKFVTVGQLTVANELGVRAVDRDASGKVKGTDDE